MNDYTIKVLGSSWKLDEWPDGVRCQHEQSEDDMRWYVPERTCEGCAFDDPATHFAYCSGCSRDVLLVDKWVSPQKVMK